MSTNKLEQLVRQYVPLPAHANTKGWFPVLCKVCHDRGHKGDRAAFNFEHGGTGYHCFNCGIKAKYNPSDDEQLSDSMQKVLRAFSIPETDWGIVLYDALVQQGKGGTSDKPAEQPVNYEPLVLDLPSYFYPLTDDPLDDYAQYAIEYLRDERSIDWTQYPFMLARRGSGKHPNKWYGRLIIPIYKDKKLIFYQGRDLTDRMVKKYETPSTPKEAILYGFDSMFDGSRNMPLYVTEGWFDAFHLDGVAVFGNTMSKAQIYWLNKTPRPKVIIPDRFGDGRRLADQALSLGWSVSTPDIANCKDVDEAVSKYGLIYVLNSIREHTYSEFEATARLGIYCE